ncbi:MAG: universal stress protein [Myxococcales bacterium]|nr:universal stress protein [Myxococcales bacterium]
MTGFDSAGLHSLLVPVDLTPASDRVLGRVARLPLAERALVTLVHVVPSNLATREQRSAEHDARQLLEDEARHLAASVSVSLRIRSTVKVGSAARVIAELSHANAVDLIVLGRGGGRVLKDAFLGSTAERVMRSSKLPVLAVRLSPHAAYRRPAMAIDLDDSVARVLPWLVRVLASPRPQVEVIHAFESAFEHLVYPSVPSDEADDRRAELRQEASRTLERRLTAALAQAQLSASEVSWKVRVRQGSARTAVPKAVKQGNVDLLALGTQGASGLAQAFLGSVAGDLLRAVGCDVLVVPPRDGSA